LGWAAQTTAEAGVERRSFAYAAAELRRLTGDDLSRVNEEILGVLRSPVAMIPEIAGHLIQSGGKRVRPMLTLAAARLFGYEGDIHIKLAAAVELIHGATLLHDDVVDASALRRGENTANIIWGNKESVLVGDFIFARAFELMVAARDLRVLEILSGASGVIAEGEVLQLATQKNLAATVDMYLEVIEAKTAALFAAATQAGAVAAGCSRADEEAMRRYGLNLGLAYQLVDDALDYDGQESALGKRTGDDFREGKMTLPVVLAYQRANAEEKAFWRRTIVDGRQSADDFGAARDALSRTGALDDTHALARGYAERAAEALDETERGGDAFASALAELAAASARRAF